MAVGDANFQNPHYRHRCMQERPCGRGKRPECQAFENDFGRRCGACPQAAGYFFENRLGARLVPDYARNVTEQSQLDLLEVVKISGFVNRAKGLGRPTKKEGRQLAEFADSVGDDGWDFDSDDFEGFDD